LKNRQECLQLPQPPPHPLTSIPFQQFTLGISSLSKLGVFGAALEVFVILYLGITSFVGFYSMPLFAKIRPKRRKTSLTHLIANSLMILILTSAIPLLSRILGELGAMS
jgi:hypothetical protein